MIRVAVKGMQTDRFEIRPGQANQLKNDESRGARIYFETNEPIGRSHARHNTINSNLVRRQAA